MRDKWLLTKGHTIIIPAESIIYDKNGHPQKLEQAYPIQLGTAWGNATFKRWFEEEVIPKLKRGEIVPGKTFIGISGNKFIQDLTADTLTKTISSNPTLVYSLPINMFAKTESDRALLNDYKSEFNKLR